MARASSRLRPSSSPVATGSNEIERCASGARRRRECVLHHRYDLQLADLKLHRRGKESVRGAASLDLTGKRALSPAPVGVSGGPWRWGSLRPASIWSICARRMDAPARDGRDGEHPWRSVTVVAADVTAEADVLSLVAAAGQQVDILVNNAGEIASDPWQGGVARGFSPGIRTEPGCPCRLIQLFAPPMMERGWGTDRSISRRCTAQCAGDRKYYKPDWDVASYFASKHGVHGITHYLAPRLAGAKGDHQLSRSPGGALTRDQLAELPRTIAIASSTFADEMVPMGRIGGEDDYAAPVVFLGFAGLSVRDRAKPLRDGWSVW